MAECVLFELVLVTISRIAPFVQLVGVRTCRQVSVGKDHRHASELVMVVTKEHLIFATNCCMQ